MIVGTRTVSFARPGVAKIDSNIVILGHCQLSYLPPEICLPAAGIPEIPGSGIRRVCCYHESQLPGNVAATLENLVFLFFIQV